MITPFVLAEAQRAEIEAQRRFDPSIRIVWAPKIQRFVICEDKLLTRGSTADPWRPRDSDLEGAMFNGPWGPQPIGERTTLEALRRLETREGDYMAPHPDIVLMILRHEVHRVGERNPLEFGTKAADAAKKARRNQWRMEFDDTAAERARMKRNPHSVVVQGLKR